MNKEQVEATLETLGGEEAVGGIQIENEPFFWVEPTDPEAILGVEFDHENELVSMMQAQNVKRVYPYSAIRSIRGKEGKRGAADPKYYAFDHLEGHHSQSFARKYGCGPTKSNDPNTEVNGGTGQQTEPINPGTPSTED